MLSFAAIVNLAICATRPITGSVIPASMGRSTVSVGLIHPVTIFKVSFST